MSKILIAAAAIYALIAIATFGQAAQAHQVACLGTPDRATCQTDMHVLTGLMGGALWPLWWSWKLAA